MIVNRRELKYPIGDADYIKLDKLFKKVLTADKNNKEGGYKIRSLYFDSLFDDDYRQKIDGEEVRKKIRLRIYDTKTQVVKLEIKRKININQIKETVSISREDAIKLIDLDYSVLLKYKDNTAKTAYNIMTLGQYRPVVIIDYHRKAYLHEENNIRVTLDSDIRSNEFNFDIFDDNIVMGPIVQYYNAVLEVKFDKDLFNWISYALTNLDTTNQSLSKYCVGRRFYESYIL